MANIASQKKRILRSERERTENRLLTSTVKTYFRRLESVVEGGDAAAIEAEHRALVSRIDKAVSSGRRTAAEVAQYVFDAMDASRFYVYSHPKALGSVQTRLDDVMLGRNPTDPFAHKPELGMELRAALRAVD